MEEMYGTSLDKKLLAAMFIVSVAIAGGFALIYLDLKENFSALQNNYANLSAQMDQLQGLIDALHSNQTASLTAVQIYNRTKNSVVIITTGDKLGSGFLYDTSGHIVTNYHVVDGSVGAISVIFLDGTVINAQFVGGDVYSDLAVIEVVNASSVPREAQPLLLGNSTQLMVGEPVYAIGNPFGLSSSMTAGIVSQVSRVLRLGDLGVPEPWGSYSIADVIQFDAAVNPGNSGGPLLNGLGLVVGVTFAIETAGNVSGFVGVGYAVPESLISRVVPSIIDTGHYVHPWLGVAYASNYVGGMYIAVVNASGPADTAQPYRLQANDVIVNVDGLQVKRGEDLVIYLERYKSPGDVITLMFVRGGDTLTTHLTLGKRS
jgi:S1-C subfamily serine protease